MIEEEDKQVEKDFSEEDFDKEWYNCGKVAFRERVDWRGVTQRQFRLWCMGWQYEWWLDNKKDESTSSL